MATPRTHSPLVPIQFHGDTIYAIEHDGELHTPVKPIIDNLGLDWRSQLSKLNNNKKRWGMVMITTPSNGGRQRTHCIPVRKLPGFLATINPSKVKNTLRSRIVLYQNECDDALWSYWSREKAQPGNLPPGILDAISTAIRDEMRKERGQLKLPAPRKPGRPAANTREARTRERMHDIVDSLPKEKLYDGEHILFLLSSGHNIDWHGSDVTFRR